jgi:CRP-like cAMP-binding protein
MTGDQTTGWALRRLRGTWLFHDLPDAALAQLANGATARDFVAGQTLVREGERGDELFVVIEGALEVTQLEAGGGVRVLGEVRKGEHLGEVALLENTARTATAKAIEPTRVLGITRGAYEACVAAHPGTPSTLSRLAEYRRAWSTMRRVRPPRSQVLEALRGFFADLPPERLDDVAAEVEWVTIPRGARLFREGEAGDALYLVVSGRLQIVTERSDGHELRLGDVGPGESVGEMALLSGEARMASARAEEDAELLRLSRVGFEALLAAHPKAMGVFARTMAARLAKAARGRGAVATLRATPFVTLAECEGAVSMADPVMLNLTITQLYHRIAVDLTVLLGAQDVNWFGFACRASKTAGASIRGEELPLRELLARSALWPLIERGTSAARRLALVRRFEDTIDTVAERVAEGNRFIFKEIGPAFVKLVQAYSGGADPSKLAALRAQFKPGPSEAGGQDTLFGALTAYADATVEPSAKRLAELILLGSLKIGLHEQIRVDPIIDVALDSPLEVFFDDVLRELPRPLRSVADLLRARLQSETRRFLTGRLMRMRLPDAELSLGEDVPGWGKKAAYPPMLETLEHPELSRLFDSLTAGQPSRAQDWTVLGDRMRFISTLFRTRQKSLQLFEPPYLEAQNAEIRARRMPSGAL